MRVFKFTMIDQNSPKDMGSTRQSVEVSIDTDDATVIDMLYHFKNFLMACDYRFDLEDEFEVVNHYKTPKESQSDNANSIQNGFDLATSALQKNPEFYDQVRNNWVIDPPNGIPNNNYNDSFKDSLANAFEDTGELSEIAEQNSRESIETAVCLEEITEYLKDTSMSRSERVAFTAWLSDNFVIVQPQ